MTSTIRSGQLITEVAWLLAAGTAETVRKSFRRPQIDADARPGTPTEETAELKRRRRKHRIEQG